MRDAACYKHTKLSVTNKDVEDIIKKCCQVGLSRDLIFFARSSGNTLEDFQNTCKDKRPNNQQ